MIINNNKIAVIFSGQNYQSFDLINEYIRKYSLIKKMFKKTSNIINYNLLKLLKQDKKKIINNFQYIQPILLTISFSMYKIWQQKKNHYMPKYMVGHSLGEYIALVCSKSISFIDGVKLVYQRGILMKKHTKKIKCGMKVIIGLKKNIIKRICEKSKKKQVLSIAAINSKKQIVIAGHMEAINRAVLLCKKYKVKCILNINIKIASHCSLMNKASEEFKKFLYKIKLNKPKCIILHNVNAKKTKNYINIRKLLLEQFYKPVMWYEIIKKIKLKGIKNFLEIGPKKILTNINKDINNINSYYLKI
ncbi:ACP S-malonyltransferase [Buchnera aphidicola (Taiwanaphis decaspermi)]|uniref:ACP S-malonyltransferase n=1 Tax=Buchnera aphidicola TaxID=9 RepID=UPI0031B84C99